MLVDKALSSGLIVILIIFFNKGLNLLFEKFSLKLTSSQQSHRGKVKPVKFSILTSHNVKISYITDLDY